jgi:hypothetical protein
MSTDNLTIILAELECTESLWCETVAALVILRDARAGEYSLDTDRGRLDSKKVTGNAPKYRMLRRPLHALQIQSAIKSIRYIKKRTFQYKRMLPSSAGRSGSVSAR